MSSYYVPNKYFFFSFSSSLLIIYEGKDKQIAEPQKNNVVPENNTWNTNSKFDFTEKTASGENCSSETEEEDEENSDSDDDDESHNLSAKNSKYNFTEKTGTKQNSHICPQQQQQLISSSPEVTMKMIDFANVTFKGFLEDSVIHIGPDSGYLKGIDTLIRILFHALKEINLQEYKQTNY